MSKKTSLSKARNITHKKYAVKPAKKESAFFLKAALIIIVVCMLCEVFLFNLSHYVTFWGDDPIEMHDSGMKVYLINMSYNDENALLIPSNNGGIPAIEFRDINRRIVTVYIDAVFDENTNKQSFVINYSNKGHQNWTTAAIDVIRGVEETKYITLQTSGNVGHVSIIYSGGNFTTSIRNITLNKPVPFKILWPRVLLLSTVVFCIVVIKRKKLFSLPLKSESVGQNILTAGIIAVFTIYLFMLMLFAAPFSPAIPFEKNFADEPDDQYNVHIVDALLDGHAYLNIEPSESLLALANPYDKASRDAAGADGLWDHALYEGKYYSYFGIVQVLVLSLPYKLITGKYIPTRVAVFLFSALAGVFLMLLWRRMVFRYMKIMPLGMYLLGMLTVPMCSMLSFQVSRPMFYEAAGSSGLFFSTLGLWLIFGSMKQEKVRNIPLTFGSLCMALAVGCRPSYMFFLIFIPVILFKDLKEAWKDKKLFFQICACAAVPCMFVAGWLMWYNYIRFGSIFDFGVNYHITVTDTRNLGMISPIGIIQKFLIGFFVYLFSPFRIEATFPFVYLTNVRTDIAFKGYLYNWFYIGVLMVPVTWFLFGIKTAINAIDKQRQTILWFVAAMVCVAFVQMSMALALVSGLHTRYELDFLWLFVYGGLICAYFIYERTAEYQRVAMDGTGENTLDLRIAVQRIICACMAISIVLFFLTTLSSSEDNLFRLNNPAIFYSIQRLLGFGLR